LNEDYLINQVNHLRAIVDEFENKSKTNDIYNIVNETIDETFWLMDLNLNFNFASASIKKIIGFSYDDLVGNSIENYLLGDSTQILKDTLSEELTHIEDDSKNNPDHFERIILNFKHKNNKMNVWCEVKIRYLLNDKLEPVSIFGTTKDITEQKLIEESLYQKMDSNDKKLSEELELTKKELELTKKELIEVKEELRKLKNKK
jgi:PAS domain S-box-containing protein